MSDKVDIPFRLWMILALLLVAGLVAACAAGEPETTTPDRIQIWLLVREPEVPLPVDRPVIVKSRSEAPLPGISHTELYLVELRAPDNTLVLDNVLIRADAAPVEQTVFTVDQTFTPTVPGHYVIKVVGYDKEGQSDESEYIGFTVQ
jgi:hypothetical protein